MSDLYMINEESLKDVTGGVQRIVDTGDERNAAIRIAPGTTNAQTASLKNGTLVNATGEFMRAGGRNWARIDYPVAGWIKASIIGFERY